MKFLFSCIFFCCSYSATLAQNSNDSLHQYSKDTVGVFEEVEEEAAFPGGDTAWRSFLIHNLNVDKISDLVKIPPKKKVFTQTIVVRFIVCKDGSLCEIKAEKKGQAPLKAEAERVIRNSPNWIPAVVKGKNVKAYRRQPITFQFEQE